MTWLGELRGHLFVYDMEKHRELLDIFYNKFSGEVLSDDYYEFGRRRDEDFAVIASEVLNENT